MVYFTRHWGSDFFPRSLWKALAGGCLTLIVIVSVIGIVIVWWWIACLFNVLQSPCLRNWITVDGGRCYWDSCGSASGFDMISDWDGVDAMQVADPSCSISCWDDSGPLTSSTSCPSLFEENLNGIGRECDIKNEIVWESHCGFVDRDCRVQSTEKQYWQRLTM